MYRSIGNYGIGKHLYGYKTIITFPKDEQLKEKLIDNINEFRCKLLYNDIVDDFQKIVSEQDDNYKVEICIQVYENLEKSRKLHSIDRDFHYALGISYGEYLSSLLKNVTILPFERYK